MKSSTGHNSYAIRSAQMEDVNNIFELIRSHPEELIVRSLSDIAQNIDRFYVAEAAGQLIGCASYGFLPEIGEMHRTTVEIKSVAVTAEWRGRGVGHKLVRQVIRRLEPLNIAQFLVLTFVPEFFAKLGFREIPKKLIMHKIYIGCINCTRFSDPFTCPEVAMALIPAESA